jgi:hypothetical protein
MTMRALERRDQMAVVSKQPVLGRRLLRQSAGFAIIDFVRLTWRRQRPLARTAKSGVTNRPGGSRH